MTPNALLVMSDGVEEIEAVAPADILTRAGVNISLAGLTGTRVAAAYGTTLIADETFDQVNGTFDALILPGGVRNAEALAAHTGLVKMVREQFQAGRLVAALCASSGFVLAEAAGILRGKRATGFPEFNEKLLAGGATVTNELVTVDGNVITGQGPGAALLFGLALVEYLVSEEMADRLARTWWLSR